MMKATYPVFFHERLGQGLVAAQEEPFRLVGGGTVSREGTGHLGLTLWAGQTQMGSHTIPAVPSTWACSVSSYASSPQCERSAFCVLTQKGTFLPAGHVAMPQPQRLLGCYINPGKIDHFITT